MQVFVYTSLIIALILLCVYIRNVYTLQVPYQSNPANAYMSISVLIPARNESRIIRQTIESIRSSAGIEFELIICDDHSSDGMEDIIVDYCKRDPRVRLIQSNPLPEGWAGKQHACWQLAGVARYSILTFIDADVQLKPDGLARMGGFLHTSNAALVSGIPRQETVSFLEKLLLPLIHWLMLCHLPMWWMRKSKHQRYGAGCGQWFMTHRDDYFAVGGHETVRSSYHDGVQLPRSFRRKGYKTDICDATSLASCRMYQNSSQVWYGLAKNAREGLAAPGMIWSWTFLLMIGHVLPVLLCMVSIGFFSSQLAIVSSVALFISILPRLHASYRFSQSWWSAILHPLGVLVLLSIQWYATFRVWFGRPVEWKGRRQPR